MNILFLVKQRSAARRITRDFAAAAEELGHTTLYIDLEEFMAGYTASRNQENFVTSFFNKLDSFNPALVFSYGNSCFSIEIPFSLDIPDKRYTLAERLDVPVIILSFDDPLAQLNSDERGLEPSWFIQSPLCMIYCWDRSFFPELRQQGYTNIAHLPMGVNCCNFFYDETPLPDIAVNDKVTFVGGPSPERVDVLRNLAEYPLMIFGYDAQTWRNDSLLRSFYRHEISAAADLRKIYSQSMVNLNITRAHGRNSANMRIFEVLACKGFLLTDYKEDLEELFDINRDLVTFNSSDELHDKLEYYCSHESARNKIAGHGYRTVTSRHSYKQRMNRILTDCREFMPLSRKFLSAKRLFYAGKFDASMKAARELLSADSPFIQNRYGHFLLGACYQEKKDTVSAEKHFALFQQP